MIIDAPIGNGGAVLLPSRTAGRPGSALTQFRERVRPRCLGRGSDHLDAGGGEDGVEPGGELAVPVSDQEP